MFLSLRTQIRGHGGAVFCSSQSKRTVKAEDGYLGSPSASPSEGLIEIIRGKGRLEMPTGRYLLLLRPADPRKKLGSLQLTY